MDTSKLGIIVDAHMGQRRFMKACFESCRKMNPAVIVCAAEVGLSSKKLEKIEAILPPYDIMALVDLWCFGEFYRTVGSWAWNQKYGLSLLSTNGLTNPMFDERLKGKENKLEYVFSIEGDCCVTKPEGIHELYDRLISEDADIISAERRGTNYAGALSYFAKIDVAISVTGHILENQRENYGNMEGRLGKAITLLGYKCVEVRNPENDQFSFGDKGTWGDILGFRHMHGEEKWRKGNKVPPMEEHFYDKRFLRGNELQALEIFWQTKETSHLEPMRYWR